MVSSSDWYGEVFYENAVQFPDIVLNKLQIKYQNKTFFFLFFF